MKKILIFLITIILTIILILNFSACANGSIFHRSRFKTIEISASYTIVYDIETDVEYVYFKGGSVSGFSVLLDKNGKPILYKGE